MAYANDIIAGLCILAGDQSFSTEELGVAAEDGCILVDGDPPGEMKPGAANALRQHGWIYVREDKCWKLYL
jgi:hypothetical protein